MRYIAVLIAIAFIIGVVPAFAVEGKAVPAEKSVFQLMYDSIKPGKIKDKNKIIPVLQKVTVFQNVSDGIAEGSKKAKPLTLRTQK